MGVRSTHIITREVAVQILLSKILSADDKAIANMLEEFPESDFRNYQIVSKEDLENNDTEQYPAPVIRSVTDF
jgi:ribosomal 50S subunit-associated protein YjgA (DUF615 family)